MSPDPEHISPQLELVGGVTGGASHTLGVETAVVVGLGVTTGTGDRCAGRRARRVRLMAAGASSRGHARVPTRVIVLLPLVALRTGAVGVELRVVSGMATGTAGMRRHPLLGKRVSILVAAGAFRGLGEIVGLVAIRARGVPRGEQQRTGNLRRPGNLWIVGQTSMRRRPVTPVATAHRIVPACVVVLVATTASLFFGQAHALVGGVDVLVARTTTGGLDHLLVGAVTCLTECRRVHLDCGHVVLRVLVATNAVPGWIRGIGFGLAAREVVAGRAVAQRVRVFGHRVAHAGAPLMAAGAGRGPWVLETSRR